MSDHFSHSRLTSLEDCPRRYRFRYVEKIAEAFQSAEAFMGTMVHEALQWLYVQREARAEPGEAQLVETYREAWQGRHGPGVRVVQDAGRIETFADEGEDMLRRHHRGAFAADRLETLAVEPKIALALRPEGEPEASYVGYIDRLARDARGVLHVIDYKTSRRMPDSMAAAGLQVRGYGLAVLETHGGIEVELRYEYLRPERSLGETFPRSRSGEVAEELSRRVARALRAERAGDFPARPSTLCRWCGYRDTCDASPFLSASPRALPAVAATQPGASPAAGGPPAPPAMATSPRGAPLDRGDGSIGGRGGSPGALAPPGSCPLCASGLRLRVSSRGALVACARYPECLHAREALPEDGPGFPA